MIKIAFTAERTTQKNQSGGYFPKYKDRFRNQVII